MNDNYKLNSLYYYVNACVSIRSDHDVVRYTHYCFNVIKLRD